MRSRLAPRNKTLIAILLVSWSLAGAVGCSEDSDVDRDHEAPAEDCQAIGDACTHDVPGGLAAECHEVYHDADAVVCAARKQECVDHCMKAMGEGGAGGAH